MTDPRELAGRLRAEAGLSAQTPTDRLLNQAADALDRLADLEGRMTVEGMAEALYEANRQASEPELSRLLMPWADAPEVTRDYWRFCATALIKYLKGGGRCVI